MMKAPLLLLLALVMSCQLHVATPFAPVLPIRVQPRSAATARRRENIASLSPSRRQQLQRRATFLQNQEDDDGLQESTDEAKGGLDAQGFAGYLAPYALAVIASIGVTVAFVKFVMLDY